MVLILTDTGPGVNKTWVSEFWFGESKMTMLMTAHSDRKASPFKDREQQSVTLNPDNSYS